MRQDRTAYSLTIPLAHCARAKNKFQSLLNSDHTTENKVKALDMIDSAGLYFSKITEEEVKGSIGNLKNGKSSQVYLYFYSATAKEQQLSYFKYCHFIVVYIWKYSIYTVDDDALQVLRFKLHLLCNFFNVSHVY